MGANRAWIAAILALTLSSGVGAAQTVDQRLAAIRNDLSRDPHKSLADAAALRNALSGSTDRGSMVAKATADWIRASALSQMGNPAEVARISAGALGVIERLSPQSSLHGELLLTAGTAADALGRVQAALTDFHAAFGIFGSVHDARGQAIALQHLAASYSDAGDFATALKYSLQSLEIFSADPMLRLFALNNAGDALNHLDRYKEAEARFRGALLAARQLGSPLLQVRLLKNIAEVEIALKDYDGADRTVQSALRLATGGPAAAWRPDLLATAANVALSKGRLDAAEALIQSAFEGAKRAQASVSLRDFHRTAYRIYRARGDDALALQHLEAFKRLDDQSRALAASASANLMSARFDFANQDLKITRLRAERAEREGVLARTRVRFHTILTGSLLAGAALITTLLAIGFVSIRRSRNQVRAANATLQQTNADLAKALDAKTEFLATTSHEIRTPLNGILGMTQVLLANRAMDAELRTRVELIHGAGETMRALVDDILDMAKMETGELRVHPAEMDLQRLLRDAGAVWIGQAETKGIALAVALADCPAGIVADEMRLRQIVFNLMSNAIKFTDRGGVRLDARAERRGAAETLVIRVEDSGIGMPADQLVSIFEAFRQIDGGVTRRHGGTGLGLAICRNLARAMGGDVTVASVLGAGSVFTLELPLTRADLPALPEPDACAPLAGLHEAELLLIDPNPLGQGILRALLTPHVRALQIVSGVDGATAPLASGRIDHLLADGAAFGLDPAAAATFAGRAGRARVSLLWPSPDQAVLDALAAGGITDVLAKPIAAPDLLARLRMRYAPPAADRDLAA